MQVTNEVKALVEAKAVLVCKIAKVANDKFNQELNAYAIKAALVAVGVKFPEDKAALDKAMQVIYKGGNTSALRQAIAAPAKQENVVMNNLLAELMEA